MKKLVFTLLISLCFYSCSKNSEENSTPTETKEYTISLDLSGEITGISNSPLSRAESNNNLYGIQVYSSPLSDNNYKPYAYGLFDNISNLTIQLLQGYKYKFACTMLVDGKTKIQKYNDGTYSCPFYDNSSSFLKISTSFVTNSSNYITYISSGDATQVDGILYDHPNIDRYYGETTDFTPSDNGSVSINMKRVSFGLKVIADGLTEGKITVSIPRAPSMAIEYPNTSIEDIYTLNNAYNKDLTWTQDDYSETLALSFNWVKSDGAVVPLAIQNVAFKRNVLTTITIKVKDNSTNNGINVSTDNTNMGTGENITIDSTSSSNTGVNPSN